MSGKGGLDASQSRRAALRYATAFLDAAGIAGAEGDARFLLLGLLGLAPRDLALDGDRPIGGAGAALSDALTRRASGEPVARILGAWEFWGLPFTLVPDTLVPRPDTETVVETALAALPDRQAPLRILDLGTGSGCILVALLSELPNAIGIGLDRSETALRTARANARANGIGERMQVVQGDWCNALRGPFDLVVSNPPYIETGIIAGLDREVAEHDPRAALDGGPDGLDAYRAILNAIGQGGLLRLGAPAILEIGYDQARSVEAIGVANGLTFAGLSRDLGGRDRVLTFIH
ncbi:peptide chain release factor N(5)-glutamine methyltransferase [Methylobacterium sp. NFXW15]|uniref:peptide chain release factor N(5)-glutamine methyltransferase n=1 Tax=Methylobacterium sp. NFXW15 TaxID=2819512 RepID=UPI003CFA8A83